MLPRGFLSSVLLKDFRYSQQKRFTGFCLFDFLEINIFNIITFSRT